MNDHLDPEPIMDANIHVIRFVPDRQRGESINIGVVGFAEGKTIFEWLQETAWIDVVHGENTMKRVASIQRAFARRAAQVPQGSLLDACGFVLDQGLSVEISAAIPSSSADLLKNVQSIASRLVRQKVAVDQKDFALTKINAERIKVLGELRQHVNALKSSVSGQSQTGTTSQTISLCMIARNDENSIKRCLSDVSSHFDQIIVVDTGSTDRTAEICASFGVSVKLCDWTDSFADARNHSLQGALCDWIFWIDPDHAIPLSTIHAVKDAIDNAPQEVVGFSIPVQFSEKVQIDKVMLFRNLPGVEWEGRIHEQVEPSLKRAAKESGVASGGLIVKLNSLILHTHNITKPQDSDDLHSLAKRLSELSHYSDNPFVLFNFGITAYYLNDHLEAIKYLKMCINEAHPSASYLCFARALLNDSLAYLLKESQTQELSETGKVREGQQLAL